MRSRTSRCRALAPAVVPAVGAALLGAFVLSAPRAAAADLRVSSGAFGAGERLAAPERNAPARASRAFVTSVSLADGSTSVEIPATGRGHLLVWAIPLGGKRGDGGTSAREADSDGRLFETALRTPSGAALAARDAAAADAGLRRFAIEDLGAEELGLDLSGRHEVLHASRAEAGTYRLDVTSLGASAVTVVAAEPESRLVLRSWAGPLSRRAGEPVELFAELSDGGEGVAGAAVVARLAAPDAAAGPGVELFDDGRHGDGAANDGLYAAAVTSLPSEASGFWSVRFDAKGTTASGRTFARTGGSGFMNERAIARLVPASVRATFVQGAEGRVLRVTAKAAVAVAGDYRFDVLVGGVAEARGSRPGVAWGEATGRLAEGAHDLALDVPLPDEARGSLHVDVRLLGLDPIGVAGRVEVDAAP